MPPCAHTEWERLTGTREKRSTGTPASQSLMTVISPASPPPTTTTRRTLPDSERMRDLVAAMEQWARRGIAAGCQTGISAGKSRARLGARGARSGSQAPVSVLAARPHQEVGTPLAAARRDG